MKFNGIKETQFNVCGVRFWVVVLSFTLMFFYGGSRSGFAESDSKTVVLGNEGPRTGSHEEHEGHQNHQDHEDNHGEEEDEGEDPDDLPVPPDFMIRPIMDHPPILFGDLNNDGISEMVIYRERRGEDRVRVTIAFFQNAPDEAVDGAINVILENRRISFAEPYIGDVDGDGNNDLVLFIQARLRNERHGGWRRIRFAVEAIDFHGNPVDEFPKFIRIDPENAGLSLTVQEDPDAGVTGP